MFNPLKISVNKHKIILQYLDGQSKKIDSVREIESMFDWWLFFVLILVLVLTVGLSWVWDWVWVCLLICLAELKVCLHRDISRLLRQQGS